MALSQDALALVFSLVSYEANLPIASLKSLSLTSRSIAASIRSRVFRTLKPLDASPYQDGNSSRDFIEALIPTIWDESVVLNSREWAFKYDVRSITITLGGDSRIQSERLSISAPNTSENIAALILSHLPHLQHVKLDHTPSYRPRNFDLVLQALAQLSRLQSLDIVGFHASSIASNSRSSPSSEMIEKLASNLSSFRFTLNNSERVENRRHPIFRSIIAHAPRLEALELFGVQKSRDIVEILAAVQSPEQIAELRLTLSPGQSLSGVTAALNRLAGLKELSVAFSDGFEMSCYPSETRTFGKVGFNETLTHLGLQLPSLRHLKLTCADPVFESFNLGCAPTCACNECRANHLSIHSRSPNFPWVSSSSVREATTPVLATPFGHFGIPCVPIPCFSAPLPVTPPVHQVFV